MARKAQPVPRSFEEALDELEKILGEIEGGEVGLEDSLLRYERGQFLIQHCRGVLGRAEKQIEAMNNEPQPQAPPDAIADGSHRQEDAEP